MTEILRVDLLSCLVNNEHTLRFTGRLSSGGIIIRPFEYDADNFEYGFEFMNVLLQVVLEVLENVLILRVVKI